MDFSVANEQAEQVNPSIPIIAEMNCDFAVLQKLKTIKANNRKCLILFIFNKVM
jgi:hypothetical protein